MKRLSVFVLIFMIALSLTACNGDKPETGMPDPEAYDVISEVNMVYGTDDNELTIYKPENASFEVEDAEDGGDLVWVAADDMSWNIDVFGAVCYDHDVPSHPFVDYYYNGELNSEEDDFASFEQEVRDLGISYMGNPVKVLEYTYTEADETDRETEFFVGVEFTDTRDGKQYGRGLLGYKFYMYSEPLSDPEFAKLFEELFISK